MADPCQKDAQPAEVGAIPPQARHHPDWYRDNVLDTVEDPFESTIAARSLFVAVTDLSGQWSSVQEELEHQAGQLRYSLCNSSDARVPMSHLGQKHAS
jgi:hypothetical protein